MKFYITGRSNNYPKVEEAFKAIKEAGHEVTFEWTTLPMCKPYDQNKETAKNYAELGINGVIEADVYIIFAHEDGNGVYTEFGAALAANSINSKPIIYAVGKDKLGSAMFNYHPAIKWREGIQQILLELNL